MKERRHDVDWLRVIATLAVLVFHCARFFDTEGWHLKSAERSSVVFVLSRGLIWPWVMELFFLLSGVGSWYALKSRTAGAYLFERVKRLLIPLYTVGLFILLPPQFYFELVTNAGYSGTFWELIPRYFGGFGLPQITPWPATLLPLHFSGHLWFLQYLFLISLTTLPLLLYLRSRWGQRWIERLARWCDRRGGIFLFVIPLALALIGLRALFRVERSWADFVWYAIYFVIGYIMTADNRFTAAFKRHAWVCLALWIVGFFGGIGLFVLVLGYDPFPGHEPFSLMYVLYQIVWSMASWSAVVFMLSLGAKYLNFNHRLLAYGNEVVLPFYLFHQTIILIVGFFVIRWNVGILPKLLVIAVISFPLILVLYELLVRPFNVVRFFFGMRPRKRPAEEPGRFKRLLVPYIVGSILFRPIGHPAMPGAAQTLARVVEATAVVRMIGELKMKKIGIGVLIVLGVGLLIWLNCALFAGKILGLTPEVRTALQSDDEVKVALLEDDSWLVMTPGKVAPATGLILYPEGHMDVRSYALISREIARQGFQVVFLSRRLETEYSVSNRPPAKAKAGPPTRAVAAATCR